MAVETGILRGWLRVIYAEAVKEGLSLQAALMLALTGQYVTTKGGKFVVATSAAGRTVQFAVIPGMSPADCFSGTESLITQNENCSAALISAGITSPTDAQIFAEMKSRLQPVTESRTDFIGLRVGHGQPVAITAA